ncbi:mitochondrial ribose methyltransferase Mrm1 [Schizosaccharomyces pombe]|uniref:rRNA methyltransferase 1, mitochondrial n=1 Tax=Schizosaccharomyces pombe (strain 972 / ATCC 24843) TaxID=284812 RepID=MRM1_SCHPO|nr:putative ribose methyltransferase [Schizosaccharomyces pombe]O94631.1 RecName: Full=rRNA methyltransferase 1, mitochondrial; AltName: Full=21S rRNA (guanosine-2'-O)-methyltransferase; AltName: Full=Mitochondrial large ribosomal RNA ribose methylase; Flags: Precursor [Schizosaccharomyces pombe 972h-]CAB37444.1 ribose methyltransferase (predicted) [Schizosaccharomyces pombe]|eukprot:NP_596705.1 putative ribose methyltransferase [Schizosaccharomyces pombe]
MIRSRVNLAREVPKKAKAHLSKERRLIKEDSEFVFGTHSVKNALATRKRECRALYVQNADIHSEFEEFLNKLQYKIPIKSVNKEHLNQITACRPHNGVVLEASSLNVPTISDLLFPAGEEYNNKNGQDSPHNDLNEGKSSSSDNYPPLYVYVDGITDPQNMGAVIRSAYILGAKGILLSKKHNTFLSPVVSKASAGALEVFNISHVKNPMVFLRNSVLKGWKVIGTKPALPDNKDQIYTPHKIKTELMNEPKILVLGSEKGLRTNILTQCSHYVSIPGGDKYVDSLNVSVAAGILLYSLVN